MCESNKIKIKKYQTIRTVTKYNRKFIKPEAKASRLDLQLSVLSVSITTEAVSSNPADVEVYTIQLHDCSLF